MGNLDVTRRGLLRGAAVATGLALGADGAHARSHDDSRAFAPVEHGFGFPNWSSRNQYFDPPPDPALSDVRDRIRTEWRGQSDGALGIETDRLPDRLVDAIATHIRSAVVQRAGTNGHCYGMVLAAQQYFERPETIPVDRRTASEIEDPTVPLEEPAAPVYDTIADLQASQYLRFRAWLGRRALFHPDWIDQDAVLRDVGSVVEAFGTAAMILHDDSLYSHQVLAYGFEDRGDVVEIPIYDPNRAAVTYRGDAPRLRFHRGGGTVSMAPYGQYTGALFNRFDRIDLASDRDGASPLDHLTVDRSTLRAALFPLVLVLVDVDDVSLAVDGPDGDELGRISGTYMDRSRGDYPRVRTGYGARPGTYRVGVFGHEETAYELTAVAAGPDGTLVNATRRATIGSGAMHEYELEVRTDGSGSLARTDGDLERLALATGAGVLGGAAAAALGYRTIRR